MKEGVPSPEYIQLSLGHPFERYDKKGEIRQKSFALNTRLSVVQELEERGYPINLEIDKERTYYEVFRGHKLNPKTVTTFTTTQEVMSTINRVVADPQLAAMDRALTYQGVNLIEGFDTALDALKGSLETFTWPHEQYVDYLMIEATRHAAAYNEELSRQTGGENLWSHDPLSYLKDPAAYTYHTESEKFLNRSRELIKMLPEKSHGRYITQENVDELASAAIERTLGTDKEQH